MFLILAAIMQFGLIFWSQNTLTQVARDTGRWASTQQECSTVAATNAVVATANQLAASATLFGYSGGWSSPTNVNVVWTTASGTCPPVGNQEVSFVRITLTYQVPIFFPFLPVSNNLTTTAEFRMEPVSK